MALSKKASEARREYQRKWREKNRERYNASMREWRENNPEKVKQYQEDYWARKAEESLKEG